jgi:hypothetical protein
MELPSERQIGDTVSISFLHQEKIRDCVIAAVKFLPSKILYDISVPIIVKGKMQGYQLVKEIPADFITK